MSPEADEKTDDANPDQISSGDNVVLIRGRVRLFFKMPKVVATDFEDKINTGKFIVRIGQVHVDLVRLLKCDIAFDSYFKLVPSDKDMAPTKASVERTPKRFKSSSEQKKIWDIVEVGASEVSEELHELRRDLVVPEANGESKISEPTMTRDNRDLHDVGSAAQGLSTEDLLQMRDSGLTGFDITKSLVMNSESFGTRTMWSQDKFVDKKVEKYCDVLIVKRPTIRLVHEMTYSRDPLRIINLRPDSMARALHLANVRPGCRYLVYESELQGLAVGACLERVIGQTAMYTKGKTRPGLVVHLHKASKCLQQYLSTVNLDREAVKDNLVAMPVEHFVNQSPASVVSNDSEKRNIGQTKEQASWSDSVRVWDLLNASADGTVDGLLIFTRHHAKELLIPLLQSKRLRPGHPFVVFSPHQSALVEAYTAVKTLGLAIMVMLTETWYRDYQVETDKTHPEVLMSASGGYLLSGYYILPDDNACGMSAISEDNSDMNHDSNGNGLADA